MGGHGGRSGSRAHAVFSCGGKGVDCEVLFELLFSQQISSTCDLKLLANSRLQVS
jgi:hypothetical protein